MHGLRRETSPTPPRENACLRQSWGGHMGATLSPGKINECSGSVIMYDTLAVGDLVYVCDIAILGRGMCDCVTPGGSLAFLHGLLLNLARKMFLLGWK